MRIESLGQVYGLMSTLSLEPEPLPLAVKVVLVGERLVYYLLKAYDPEFDELFKVAADFEDEVVRDATNTQRYACFIATLAREEQLRPLEAAAVARVIEHAARLADDAERLSAATRRIRDLMIEADHLAGEAGRSAIGAVDIKSALAARRHRADRLREAGFEQILRGVQLIDSAGSHTGQVNGLAVFDLGEYRFGHPVRITATARMGEGDVVDIERESEMGGEIHTKGVLILSAFLAARYARVLPLSLSASLVFEQSYGPVEGDSASLAELCALLSALSGVPIRQSLAVTGSVTSSAASRPSAASMRKIEGFFDICAARGLSGDQGVIIPAANVMHLMLRDDVVAACAAGSFRIWAVADVDQAIELLTGVPAGEPNEKGEVSRAAMNYLVATQLAELSELRQAFGIAARGKRRKRKRDE